MMTCGKRNDRRKCGNNQSSKSMVEAERFISFIIREPFDYTKWQQDLFDDMSVEELSKKKMNFANSKK
jgi:hypothetical protein